MALAAIAGAAEWHASLLCCDKSLGSIGVVSNGE
jgi:hypothetical protein